MSEGAPSDQLPINLGLEYRVKLGKSFTFPKKNAFHTLKCEYSLLCPECTCPIMCPLQWPYIIIALEIHKIKSHAKEMSHVTGQR